MKIISSGTFCADDHSVIFACLNCGCKFKAAPDEYYQDSSSWNDTISANYTIYSYPKYHANCPECQKMCHESGKKQDNNYYVTCDGASISSTSEVSNAGT